MKNLESIQKMFNLFEIGDVANGNIVAILENGAGAKIKTSGGCYGSITGKIPDSMTEGSAVEVIVTNIQEGLPIFEFTSEFLFDKIPQEATICFVGPRALIVEFNSKPEIYGSYQPQNGLEEPFKNLNVGDIVMVSDIKQDNPECYRIGKVSIKEKEAVSAQKTIQDKQENTLLCSWTSEKIESVFKNGSRKKYGKLCLGKVYAVTRYGKSNKEVQFPDGQVGDLNVCFPKNWARAMVRVVFITQKNRPKAELLCQEQEDKMQPKKTKEKVSQSEKNKFRNEELFRKALAAGSCYRAGGYWLGYNYKTEIKEGLPYFAPTNEDPKNILERAQIIIKQGCSFKEGDYVCAEIAFIRREGNTHNYTFEVNILKVF